MCRRAPDRGSLARYPFALAMLAVYVGVEGAVAATRAWTGLWFQTYPWPPVRNPSLSRAANAGYAVLAAVAVVGVAWRRGWGSRLLAVACCVLLGIGVALVAPVLLLHPVRPSAWAWVWRCERAIDVSVVPTALAALAVVYLLSGAARAGSAEDEAWRGRGAVRVLAALAVYAIAAGAFQAAGSMAQVLAHAMPNPMSPGPGLQVLSAVGERLHHVLTMGVGLAALAGGVGIARRRRWGCWVLAGSVGLLALWGLGRHAEGYARVAARQGLGDLRLHWHLVHNALGELARYLFLIGVALGEPVRSALRRRPPSSPAS